MKRVLELLNGSVLLVMFLVTMTQVVFRVILKIPSSWSEEMARYFFVTMVFIGSASIMESESHISISVIVDRLSAKGKKILRIASRFLIFFFLLLFVGGAYVNMKSTWSAFLPTVEWMRIGYIYLLLLITGSISIVYLVLNMVTDILNIGRFNNDSGRKQN